MRYSILVAVMVLAISGADSTWNSIRSASRCRTLSEIESSAIYGAFGDTVYECKKKGICWDLLPYLCAEVSLDPTKNGTDLGTVSLKCSQTVQVDLFKNGPNEECQESKKDENKCYQQAGSVPCRRVTNCVWNSELHICVTGLNFLENTAPPDCLNL